MRSITLKKVIVSLTIFSLLCGAAVVFFGRNSDTILDQATTGCRDSSVLSANTVPTPAEIPHPQPRMNPEKSVFASGTDGRERIDSVTSGLSGDICLLGTVQGSPRDTYAVMRSLTSRKEKTFRLGDKVFNQGTLKKVSNESVVLTCNEKEITLFLNSSHSREVSLNNSTKDTEHIVQAEQRKETEPSFSREVSLNNSSEETENVFQAEQRKEAKKDISHKVSEFVANAKLAAMQAGSGKTMELKNDSGGQK